ncbi:MAG: iron-containing alcohol dehydrogenase [Pseudomonadota bacterium]|nr:iron-containing alcohol dehydrogenase [Pseudomonadota bacterium]
MPQTGIFNYPSIDRIVFGEPLIEAVQKEADRLSVERIFVLASGTISRETPCIEDLRATMKGKIAGVFDRLRPHVQRDDVIAATAEARAVQADLILTIGGGTPTDAAKMVSFCLANDVSEYEDLDPLRWVSNPDGTAVQPPSKVPTVRSIFVPTTLSAGEFSAGAGCTDSRRHAKQMFRHPLLAPVVVILDPAICLHTPEWLWLSTGIRAVDHVVEDLCSINLQPYVEGTARHALRLLADGLLKSKTNPDDLDARLNCQTGAWMSMIGGAAGVKKGASHGIGHMLGGVADVPHGYTSCVMLPSVLAWNEGVNDEQQAVVSETLGRPGEPASQVIGELISGLGMPTRLRDVGVKQDQFQEIAAASMHDRWIPSNPRKITDPAQVVEILEMAW